MKNLWCDNETHLIAAFFRLFWSSLHGRLRMGSVHVPARSGAVQPRHLAAYFQAVCCALLGQSENGRGSQAKACGRWLTGLFSAFQIEPLHSCQYIDIVKLSVYYVMPQSMYLPIFLYCGFFFFNFFTFVFSRTGTERPKLQPTQCDSCKHNIPKVWQAASLVTVTLPISGLTETGHSGSGVLGSPWHVWGGNSSSAQVCSYTERGQMGDKNHTTRAWEENIFAPFACLVIPHKTQLSILGEKKGMGSGLEGPSWGRCYWGKRKRRAHSGETRLIPQWKTSPSKQLISGSILFSESRI